MPNHSDTLAARFARHARQRADQIAPPITDADRVRAYANPPDPVGFARDILGIKLWSRQRELVESICCHKRVACCSGHKTGKSTSAAVISLWFYCSFPGARVVITAPRYDQVQSIIYREIKRLCRQAKVKIPGAAQMGTLARTGITDLSDFSEIRGYTARDQEAIAGTSGAFLLYVIDEASGVDDAIFEAIEGNRAGGTAWTVMISNPTKARGTFFDAFHSKSKENIGDAGYHTIQIDSRESPNVTGEWREIADAPVKGLADPDWIQEKLHELGEDDPWFQIRIAGSFLVAEDAKIFTTDMIGDAQKRWAATKSQEGRLWIGCDPAGSGLGGDESGFCARIGNRVEELIAKPGLSPQAHILQLETLIATYHRGGPRPVVLIDSEGDVGHDVYQAVRAHAEQTQTFECVRIRASDKPRRQPHIYGLMRDELWANASRWVREGGAFPPNKKLEEDLHAPEFTSDIRGRLKVTHKKELRKILGRSPDIGDAFVLCCWEPLALRAEEQPRTQVPERTLDPYVGRFDPYSGSGGLNPYAGR